jgi:LysR family glycine cleavage system transcriptional activator
VETALNTLTAATLPFLGTPGKGHLTVAASVSMIDWVIAPNLPAFMADNPDTSVRFLGTIWPDEFTAPRADVEIRFGSARQVGKDAMLMTPNRLVALKSPDLTGGLPTLPLIETVGTSEGWKDWGAAHDAPHLKPTVFADSYGLSLRLAQHGNGVALVDAAIAGHALKAGTLVTAHPGALATQQGYYLSIQSDDPMARAFAGWLQHIGKIDTPEAGM